MIAASVPSGGYDPMPKGLVFYAPGNGGYSDRRLDEKRYLISVHTGAVTPFQRVKDIALARASERTLELKNKFFKLGPERLKLECLGSRVGTATNIASGRPTYELEIELAGNKPGHNLIDAEKTFQKLRPKFDVQPSTKEKVKAMGFYRHRCMKQGTNQSRAINQKPLGEQSERPTRPNRSCFSYLHQPEFDHLHETY